MSTFYIKTNRIFTFWRNWTWLFIIIVAFGGLWYPKLGLLMIPVMLALPLLGFAKGKYWCGNICPHGSLFDRFIQPLSVNRKMPKWTKSKITIVIAFSWFMYILGSRLFKVFSIWGTVPFMDKLGFVFVMNYLMVTIIGTVLALLVAPRAWCNFCPMSTFQVLFYKLGKLLGVNQRSDQKISISNSDKCYNCGKCARVCPIQLTPYLEFSEKNQFDNEACIRCSTCVYNCPAEILSLGKNK
jgi:polyferredoxin